MEKERLKMELVDKIQKCQDLATLQRVEEVLMGSFQASEPGKDYISEQKTKLLEEFNISPEQEEELIRRYRDYLEGKTEGDSWKM